MEGGGLDRPDDRGVVVVFNRKGLSWPSLVFTRSCDPVFASEGVESVKIPVRAPKANAIAECFVGTARRECLDWLLILNRRHLERVLRVFVDHYGCKSSCWTGGAFFARVAVGRG